MVNKCLGVSLVLLAGATSAFAADTSFQALVNHGMRVDGAVPHKITLANNQTKVIRLLNITLSPAVSQQLAKKSAELLQNPYQRSVGLQAQDLPDSKYLGMNGEAVLDQGEWGTCATFSTTAAINALFPLSGDSQVSQLCNLELGQTLGNGYQGGWQGSFGYVVLGQVNQYGFINKGFQHATGCGGLKQYPAYSEDNGSAMAVADFTAHSSMTFTDKDWTPIISYNGTFAPLPADQAAAALTNVKQALNQGYRVVFGSLIDSNVGQVGAAGTYNGVASDTWVMTSQISEDFKNQNPMEGHEIVIDGYDDKACASYTETDGSQKQQCGLLRIRNSWSATAGYQGDYYMSYDHFKGMVIEAYAIGSDVKDNFKPATKTA